MSEGDTHIVDEESKIPKVSTAVRGWGKALYKLMKISY